MAQGKMSKNVQLKKGCTVKQRYCSKNKFRSKIVNY